MRRWFIVRWFYQYRLIRDLWPDRGRWHALCIGWRYARWGL